MFERETRREKILEARNRELKLKEKEKAGGGAAHEADSKDKKDTTEETGLKEVDPIEKAEKDFFKIVEEEKNKRKKKQV